MFWINLRETPLNTWGDLTESELVDIVNEEDKVIGTRTLGECLRAGLLHREVTVFLRDSNGQILLQQRSKSDDWLPGKWTASCTGHVKAGEDPVIAATRELKEELGISIRPRYLFKFVVPEIQYMGKIEREINLVFEANGDGQVKIDPKEVEQVVFFPIQACKEFFRSNIDMITLDARIAFDKYQNARYH